MHPRLQQCLLCLCCTGSEASLFQDHFEVLWNAFGLIAGCKTIAKFCGCGLLRFCCINCSCCNLPVARYLENFLVYCTEKSQTLDLLQFCWKIAAVSENCRNWLAERCLILPVNCSNLDPGRWRITLSKSLPWSFCNFCNLGGAGWEPAAATDWLGRSLHLPWLWLPAAASATAASNISPQAGCTRFKLLFCGQQGAAACRQPTGGDCGRLEGWRAVSCCCGGRKMSEKSDCRRRSRNYAGDFAEKFAAAAELLHLMFCCKNLSIAEATRTFYHPLPSLAAGP